MPPMVWSKEAQLLGMESGAENTVDVCIYMITPTYVHMPSHIVGVVGAREHEA